MLWAPSLPHPLVCRDGVGEGVKQGGVWGKGCCIRRKTQEREPWVEQAGTSCPSNNIYFCKNSNTVSISLKGDDIAHLEKFKIFINASNNIRSFIQKINNKEYSICNFSVCNKHFKETLINLGCIPKKSLVLKFPNLNIFEQFDLVYPFIRGYIDGDGCLTFSKAGRLELSILGTKEFLEGIRLIFPNKFASIHKIKRLKTNVYKISNCGNNADEVSYKLYNNATIYLDRKFNRFAVLNRKV